MIYVKIRSWHIEAITYRGGAVGTRCGRIVRVEGTISMEGAGPIRETSDTLPANERTCETCLALTVRDEDPA